MEQTVCHTLIVVGVPAITLQPFLMLRGTQLAANIMKPKKKSAY